MAATKISGFDMEDFWDDLPVSRLKYNALDNFQEVFQTTSRRSSRRLPGSVLDDFQEVFNPMVLIFHSIKGFSDLDLICWFFRSGKLLGRLTCLLF
ncbi:hypothetical protein F2Q69_00005036 [Brassica cretica]|uniref:Uncharacterized protein n=1 Tax=Brassica cretica TaxID=69181 RepID=A0A8S9P8J5_BRACR|nr:hypothetical protein F2Q69_00005036 [Brassica cretica]